MKLKAYAAKLADQFPADSTDPTVIVQQLACLAAVNLASKGKLPAAVGRGKDIDMDVVQAGILAGLEKIKLYDGTLGTLRAFLYKTIAGTIQNYAWARENRVQDNHNTDLSKILIVEPPTDEEEETFKHQPLVDPSTPLSIAMDMEEQTAQEALGEVLSCLNEGEKALLMKDAAMGYNAPERQKWADSMGITVASLRMRLFRLRERAREWYLSNH